MALNLDGTGVVMGYQIGPNADLRGADLVYADLSFADLRDADLTDANLTDANLINANLTNANLEKANLWKANLFDANLTDANLTDANLDFAQMRGSDLTGANLTDAILPKNMMSGRWSYRGMHGAKYSNKTIFSGLSWELLFPSEYILVNRKIFWLDEKDITDFDFSNLNLSGKKLQEKTFSNCNFENTLFVGSNFYSSHFINSNLTNTDFTDAYLHKIVINGSNFTDSIYDKANLVVVESRYRNPVNTIVSDLRDKEQSLLKFTDLDFSGKNFVDYNFSDSIFVGVNFSDADLTNAIFRSAVLENIKLSKAILVDAIFNWANLKHANLSHADLTNADLTDANLRGARLSRANLTDATYDENIKDALWLDEAIGYYPRITGKSYGAMTGPILKLGKPDSPAKASEFKRRYPAEFERLKGDTSGRDFTESMKKSLREKYVTPFDWVIKKTKYGSNSQRISKNPNRVLLLNVDVSDPKYTEKQRELLEKLSEVSRRSNHPHAESPLFTIGWVRYDKNDKAKVLLIEEVQSDIEIVRKQLKGESDEAQQLRDAGIDPNEFVEVAELMRPYSDRFYEDAIGLIFQEAEALGYTVEMLPYEAKKQFCYYDERKKKEICPPISVYVELPKRLGMTARRESESLPDLPAPVRYYKPNPGKGSK